MPSCLTNKKFFACSIPAGRFLVKIIKKVFVLPILSRTRSWTPLTLGWGLGKGTKGATPPTARALYSEAQGKEQDPIIIYTGLQEKLKGKSSTWSLFILGSRGREGRAKGGFRTFPTSEAVPPQTLWYNEQVMAILLKKGACPSYFLLLCFSCLGTNGRLYRSHLIPVSPLQWFFGCTPLHNPWIWLQICKWDLHSNLGFYTHPPPSVKKKKNKCGGGGAYMATVHDHWFWK